MPYCPPCSFFFSSRRRHTRLVSDWSSDVCSSDLFVAAGDGVGGLVPPRHEPLRQPLGRAELELDAGLAGPRRGEHARSEERRVGKECRSRWGPDHSEKQEERREQGQQYQESGKQI